ncbi:ComEC/Rec2 family competence protein [Lachnoclostridium phytofermentans]|uniref:Beta-lactamase domain protein n=1 Tax=Lachnoclostridium phytofermentans (strain ATCC 700394 / DSM 18823 / ISDg) TaxID=357809 RepID=A9KIP1_LACP7|nr:ComEC/Rec2 family competence protein [Lachnoclostridium phytofermentans]ABX43904.1 beta-lactamase domain protein [Lachnoclostridium phytofermentans ISDg]
MKRNKKISTIIKLLLIIILVIGQYLYTSDQRGQTEENKETSAKDTDDPLMKVHFIDVGQADCILVENNNKYMLVDGGNNDDKDVILDYLNRLGVKEFEAIIMTHPHEDHIGSIDTVIREFKVKKIYAPKKEHTTKTYEDVLNAVIETGNTLNAPKSGEKFNFGAVTVTFLAPSRDYGNNLNNWSIGIKVSNGKHSFVMCGDAEKEAEEDMLATKLDLSADVLKLSHHGSDTSSTKEFVKAVNPKYAVISVGKGNTYGHPSKSTIKMLKNNKIKYFRTDEQGTIVMISDGDQLTCNVSPIP